MKTLDMDIFFERCVTRTVRRSNRYDIDCKLGLWGASGPDPESVEREARHYWIQYFSDGEYRKLIPEAYE